MMSGFSARRVVVTGMGAITPLGKTLEASWKALLLNESGVTSLESALELQGLPIMQLERELAAAKALPCQVAAPVHEVAYDARTPRFVQFALEAGAQAVRQAKLDEWLGGHDDGDDESDNDVIESRRDRVGACVGSGMSSVREIVEAAKVISEGGLRRLSPHFVPKVLANSASGRLSLEYKLRGPNHSASTACAAGAHSIGDAMRCIQYGNADIMLAGGAEACIDPLSMAGFSRLRALSTSFNEHPSDSSRPFDRRRDGFVMGEGSAILVLEELEHAKQRGAPILAELRGYGLTGDAHHITSPDPEGRGAKRAINMALASAGMDACDVDYINAHATSTPKGDEIESGAIDETLIQKAKNREYDLHVSSTKGSTGHLLGAAGAAEAAFTVMSLADGSIPPTRNLEDFDDVERKVGFRHVTETLTGQRVEVAMSNSFGFGGTNACLIFSKYHGD